MNQRSSHTEGARLLTRAALGASMVLLLGARLCYLLTRYGNETTRASRPQIESGALLLVIVGLSFRIANSSRVPESPAHSAGVPRMMWLGTVCLAVALYWPALFVGFLSDDFILVVHAAAWQWGPVALQLFRPLPLMIWSVILHLGGGAVALHLLNILLHGTNAYLAMRVLGNWVRGRWWAVWGGLIVLTAPLAPEAVAWCAGVFDLLATALILTAVLVARRYDAGPRRRDRALLILLSVSALLSKETAAVAPLLIGIDAWARGALRRRLIQDLVVAGAVSVVAGAIRLVSHFGLTTPSISKYRLQRVLFDSFGSLAAPWHVDLSTAMPAVTLMSVLLLILLFTTFFVLSGPRTASRTMIAGGLWVIVSVLPILPTFYVSPELQGSRYLYLAMLGWAGIVTTACAALGTRRRWLDHVTRCAIVGTIMLAAYATRVHLRPWGQASDLRDIVLEAAARDGRLHMCDTVYVRDLPQSLAGAYLFPNGAREALAGAGVNAYVRDVNGACSFKWDAVTSRFEPVER